MWILLLATLRERARGRADDGQRPSISSDAGALDEDDDSDPYPQSQQPGPAGVCSVLNYSYILSFFSSTHNISCAHSLLTTAVSPSVSISSIPLPVPP